MNKWIVRLWISHTNNDKLKYIYTRLSSSLLLSIKKMGMSARVREDHMEERERGEKERKNVGSYDGCIYVCLS
jgi:hypothetical protein